MTVVQNLMRLKIELEGHPGPKPDLMKWHEWLDDAIAHIGGNDAPSSEESRAQENMKGGEASGEESGSEGTESQGENAEDHARV